MIHSRTVIAIEPIRLAADQPFALARPEAAAGIPDQMADAAQHVVDQRPGVAEQDQPADPGTGEPFESRIAVGPAAAISHQATSSVPK